MRNHFIKDKDGLVWYLRRDERKNPELSDENSEFSNQTTEDPAGASHSAYHQRDLGVPAGSRGQRGDNVRATSLAEKSQMDCR